MKRKQFTKKQHSNNQDNSNETRKKGAESRGLPGNKENEILVSVEAKQKMVEKPSPNYVVEREVKGKTTQQPSFRNYRTPSSPRKQQGQT